MNEQDVFNKHKSEWLADHENEWVWILGEQATFYSSFERAIEAAYSAGFDKQPIFIKQVLETEIPLFIAGLSHRFKWAG